MREKKRRKDSRPTDSTTETFWDIHCILFVTLSVPLIVRQENVFQINSDKILSI